MKKIKKVANILKIADLQAHNAHEHFMGTHTIQIMLHI